MAEEKNVFREAEKRYRLKKPPTKRKKSHAFMAWEKASARSLDGVVDLCNLTQSQTDMYGIERVPNSNAHESQYLNKGAQVYRFKCSPGFHIIQRALDKPSQYNWAKTCLNEYSCAKHTNISNLHGTRDQELWTRVWTGKKVDQPFDFTSLDALRWASLGYHYDWTMRCYSKGNKTPHPTRLSELASEAACMVGQKIRAEASIVNFYPESATMGGHLDDAELSVTNPIVSISLGCSAVFLLGGPTKAIEPVAFLLRSGDISVMAGESRMCVHGVPRIVDNSFEGIVPNSFTGDVNDRVDKASESEGVGEGSSGDGAEQANEGAGLEEKNIGEEKESAVDDKRDMTAEMQAIDAYLTHHRINVNIRQVEDAEYTFDNIPERLLKRKYAPSMSMGMSMEMGMQPAN